MKVVIDLDSHQAIQDFGNRSPVGAYQFKSQDTVEWEIYFVQGGVVQDFGSGFALKFGMIEASDPARTLLAYQTTFAYSTDAAGNVYYSGLINFNTAEMATAIGTQPSIQGTAEIRYQDSLSEIIHSINIGTIVYATILVETGVTPPGVSTGYPDASTLELLVHKNAINGYAGLDAQGDLAASIIPVDTQTIVVNSNGDIANAAILATTAANFTTPAVNANVTVTVNSTANIKPSSFVRLPTAGYYIVLSITDSTHCIISNNGDPFNAASGVTIPSGTVVLPAQAAAGGGGGSPGQNAYTTTLANFTVPASGATVNVNLESTSWLAGSGQVLFIQSAGYYAVSSIPDSTHAILTNLGYASTNAASGITIASGAGVSPGGLQGPASTASGGNAYDTTQASFVMPAAAASINVTITNTSWLGVGQEVYITGAGYFSVASITSPTIFSATNSNYPGAAAPGSTIASGAKVSPAGVIGAQGAGGPGLNAFTTLAASFVQPNAGTGVGITVGTTAWMATGQVIYIVTGGYYSVTTITDLTHVTVTNLGYSNNATPTTTVPNGGAVTPGGTIGQAGATPYTTTSAIFVMPAISNSVTVNVANTSFMISGQNVFVQNAGYFTIASVSDPTHVVLTNNGASGNTASGSTIPSGSSVSSSGANGATGGTGAQGPAGRDGAYSTIYTQYSLSGTGGVGSPAQLVNDAAQGTNAYAHYQRDVSGNNFWGPIPTDGTTITVTAGKLTVIGGGGGSGAWDPASGFYWYDDFIFYNAQQYFAVTAGLSPITSTNYGLDSTRKFLGSLTLGTGTASTGTVMDGICLGSYNSQVTGFLPGLGAVVLKWRVAFPASLPTTGAGYMARLGLGATPTGGGLSSTWWNPANMGQQAFLEYSPDNNSGQWRISTGTTSANYVNTSVAIVADTVYDLEIDINAAASQYVFIINGTTVATISTNLPTGALYPFCFIYRNTTPSTAWLMQVDYLLFKYSVTR